MVAPVRDGDLWLGHPKGLWILVLTEMWERFSYYGMRALLVFFLTERFLYSDTLSFTVYGSYTALVYISPILGGLLADRYLGFSKAVLFGGILMMLGHIGLAAEDLFFPARAGVVDALQLQIFYLSLAFLIVGVGLLKPNISTMVGGLYPKEGYLRDSGFTVFVFGVNFGATTSAVLCGYVGHRFGWGYGFGLAAVGILIGMCTFVGGQKHLTHVGQPPDPQALRAPIFMGFSRQTVIIALVLLSVFGVWQLVQMFNLLGSMVAGTIVVSVGGAILYAMLKLERVQRQQLFAALLLMSIWVLFAAIVEQMGSSINLFTERVVNRQIGSGEGMEIRSAQLQGLLPFLVMAFSPVFAWLWGYLEARRLNPSTPVKFCFSLVFLALGYGSIVVGCFWPDANGRVHIGWLTLLYIFFAIGDLLIVPPGLSAITKLAVGQVLGFMMGLWMLSVAIGNYFAAAIANLSALEPAVQARAQPGEMMLHYQTFFTYLAGFSLALGLFALIMTPLIRKWMHGVR